jgi:hypothetical protein
MSVNHIGHAYLTELLMSKLIVNIPSRFVVLSSDSHDVLPINYQPLDHMNSKADNAKRD